MKDLTPFQDPLRTLAHQQELARSHVLAHGLCSVRPAHDDLVRGLRRAQAEVAVDAIDWPGAQRRHDIGAAAVAATIQPAGATR